MPTSDDASDGCGATCRRCRESEHSLEWPFEDDRFCCSQYGFINELLTMRLEKIGSHHLWICGNHVDCSLRRAYDQWPCFMCSCHDKPRNSFRFISNFSDRSARGQWPFTKCGAIE